MPSEEMLQQHELDVAKAIRSGDLTSPQQYENIWLFDVRITGTGVSYRSSLDEYVFRDPDHFLTDDFVERCNGIPLIFEHPAEVLLDTEEFRDRSVGVVILPYVKDAEVWGIAKVHDQDAVKLMKTTHKSTSPSVKFADKESTKTLMVDGRKLLIEGTPSYLDHLAICEVGVWDKGEDPHGVMFDEEESTPAWADSLIKRMDAYADENIMPGWAKSISERLDALEKQ